MPQIIVTREFEVPRDLRPLPALRAAWARLAPRRPGILAARSPA